jgi:hypothetical protein
MRQQLRGNRRSMSFGKRIKERDSSHPFLRSAKVFETRRTSKYLFIGRMKHRGTLSRVSSKGRLTLNKNSKHFSGLSGVTLLLLGTKREGIERNASGLLDFLTCTSCSVVSLVFTLCSFLQTNCTHYFPFSSLLYHHLPTVA